LLDYLIKDILLQLGSTKNGERIASEKIESWLGLALAWGRRHSENIEYIVGTSKHWVWLLLLLPVSLGLLRIEHLHKRWQVTSEQSIQNVLDSLSWIIKLRYLPLWLTIWWLLLTWLSIRLLWLQIILLLLIIELNVNMNVLYALERWHRLIILIDEILLVLVSAADIIPEIIDIGDGYRSVPVLTLHGGYINVLAICIHCPLLPVTSHKLLNVASEISKPIHGRIIVIPVLLGIRLLPLYRSWLWLWLWDLLCLPLLLFLLRTC
jgi:hypothetical protein